MKVQKPMADPKTTKKPLSEVEELRSSAQEWSRVATHWMTQHDKILDFIRADPERLRAFHAWKSWESDLKTDPALLRMLYRSAVTTMTETEIREQRISWVIGQTGATRKQVEKGTEL
jgi:hypothetical protein